MVNHIINHRKSSINNIKQKNWKFLKKEKGVGTTKKKHNCASKSYHDIINCGYDKKIGFWCLSIPVTCNIDIMGVSWLPTYRTSTIQKLACHNNLEETFIDERNQQVFCRFNVRGSWSR